MDYEDLLGNAVSVLDVPHVNRVLCQQYSHILIDEFQVRRMHNLKDFDCILGSAFDAE